MTRFEDIRRAVGECELPELLVLSEEQRDRIAKTIDGAILIAFERHRQIIKEGFTLEHDGAHEACELLDAAICYAGLAGSQLLDKDHGEEAKSGLLDTWPWESEWWKPDPDPVRNLVKAGALIAAEIDRLRRKREEDGQH